MAAPVFLNHFFLTLDKATFQAVKAQDWLRTALAPFEERTTKRSEVRPFLYAIFLNDRSLGQDIDYAFA